MTIMMGICSGSQPIVSYNHGAGHVPWVRQTLSYMLASSLAVSAASLFVIRWQAPVLASLFLAGHVQAIALTVDVANFLSWALLFIPVGIVGSAFFTSLEQARKSLLVAIARGWSLLWPVWPRCPRFWVKPESGLPRFLPRGFSPSLPWHSSFAGWAGPPREGLPSMLLNNQSTRTVSPKGRSLFTPGF